MLTRSVVGTPHVRRISTSNTMIFNSHSVAQHRRISRSVFRFDTAHIFHIPLSTPSSCPIWTAIRNISFHRFTMPFHSDISSLTFLNEHEILRIEAWGPNALRVRSTREGDFPSENWALDTKPPVLTANVQQLENGYTINNGNITASLSPGGKLKFTNQHGKLVLSEIFRSRVDGEVGYCSALRVDPREFKARLGTESWHVTVRFQSLDEDERIYGMGQYQQSCLNLKGCDLELAHRNAQASVPFALSSLGYGFMWNNPATGRAVFGKNQTTFEAHSTRVMDYWVVVGDTPHEMLSPG